MPSSYVSNHVHIAFSTKHRAKTIREELQPQLWAYMAGVAKNHSIRPVSIGGVADHAHVLVNLGPTLSISKAAQVLKANSSRWMNEHIGKRFEWQEGYFACSVSQSQVAAIRRYVANQKQHHHKMDSRQEFELLLKRHGLEMR